MDREHPLLFPLASTPVDGLSEEHPTTTNEPVLRDSISRLQLISPAQLFFYNNTKYKNAFSKLFKSLSMVPNTICTVMGDGGEADGRPGEQSRTTTKKTAIPAATFVSEVTLPVYFTERIIDRDGPAPSGPLHHHKYYLLVSLFHLYICEGVTSNIVYFTPIKNIRNIVVCNKKVGEIVLKTANYYYRQRQKDGEAHPSVKTYCYGDCVFSLKDKNETDFLIHVIKQIISVPRTYFNFFFSGPSNGTETGKRFEFHDSFLASEEHWAKGDSTTSRYANVVEHWPSAEVKALPSRLKPYFFYDKKRRNKKFPPLIAVYYEEVVNTRLFFRNDNNNNNNTNIKSELRFLETLFHLEPLEYTCASFDQQGNEKGDDSVRAG
ncbi:hypothetical protein ADEAN_000970000 [Angomonas deanei]|uniref:Uncharacterized protein n=1 Tax=Angomonas deanei TaxID=59799 RepID=A0A7G2CSZ4_9TRYP|nr:hypothetical protein ADEAN_000970000 [Angomonas deanei]